MFGFSMSLFSQGSQSSLESTIDVNSYPIIDWTFIGLLTVFLGVAVYAITTLLDEKQYETDKADTAVEWSQLTRTIRTARNDFRATR